MKAWRRGCRIPGGGTIPPLGKLIVQVNQSDEPDAFALFMFDSGVTVVGACPQLEVQDEFSIWRASIGVSGGGGDAWTFQFPITVVAGLLWRVQVQPAGIVEAIAVPQAGEVQAV